MENEFVTYEIAKLLKELNFDEPCLAWYYFNEENSSYALNSFKQDYGDKFDWWKYSELDSDAYVDHLIAPLWQQAIDWLREKHDIDIELPYGGNKDKYYVFVQEYIYEGKDPKQFTYYGAREQAILKAIEIIKSA